MPILPGSLLGASVYFLQSSQYVSFAICPLAGKGGNVCISLIKNFLHTFLNNLSLFGATYIQQHMHDDDLAGIAAQISSAYKRQNTCDSIDFLFSVGRLAILFFKNNLQ